MDKNNKIIFHVDINSCYLSAEAVYRLQQGSALDLREIAAVVGGDEESRHGIVLAKSIPAKKYNIQTGDTLYNARQKCPELVIVPPRYWVYMYLKNIEHKYIICYVMHSIEPICVVYFIILC